MKTFVTSGLGSQQSLENIQDEKIPVYDTLSDAQSDLANLEEGQIIATRDYGTSAPVVTMDTFKAVVAASSDFADFQSRVAAL